MLLRTYTQRIEVRLLPIAGIQNTWTLTGTAVSQHAGSNASCRPAMLWSRTCLTFDSCTRWTVVFGYWPAHFSGPRSEFSFGPLIPKGKSLIQPAWKPKTSLLSDTQSLKSENFLVCDFVLLARTHWFLWTCHALNGVPHREVYVVHGTFRTM